MSALQFRLILEKGGRGETLSPDEIDYLRKREREFSSELAMKIKLHNRIVEILTVNKAFDRQ
jgi:hypothetical protein